jgi:DNA-directed RNA polymerase specialized sigma24 family protein
MGRKTFEGLVFQYLLNNFERYRLFKGEKEKWGDYVSWLYPRLSRAIDYYKERGANFDTYISTIIQWSSREYLIREAEHRATEYACWKARAEEMQTCCPEPDYFLEIPLEEISDEDTQPEISLYKESPGDCALPDESVIKIKSCLAQKKITPKQILFLVLKSYYFISDDFLCQIAATTGMNKKELRSLIDELHLIRSKREAHIRELQDRIHSQYYRCLAFQNRLSAVYAGTVKHAKLTNNVEKAWKRFYAMRKRLSGIRVDATNQQIATLLKIPKGTVDSTLHNVREKWNAKIGSGE